MIVRWSGGPLDSYKAGKAQGRKWRPTNDQWSLRVWRAISWKTCSREDGWGNILLHSFLWIFKHIARMMLTFNCQRKWLGLEEHCLGLLTLTQRWSICHHFSLGQFQLPVRVRRQNRKEGGYQSEWWCKNFTSPVTVHTWDKFRRMLGHWGFRASHAKGKSVK